MQGERSAVTGARYVKEARRALTKCIHLYKKEVEKRNERPETQKCPAALAALSFFRISFSFAKAEGNLRHQAIYVDCACTALF